MGNRKKPLNSENNETDRLALLDFKAKISKDPLRIMNSWNDSIHFCQWTGVSCGRQHQKVTGLDLQSQKLVDSISPNIENLSFLRKLNLENNSFYNEIPQEIGRLHRLQVLQLNNNTINATIPSNLSSCANLILFHVAVWLKKSPQSLALCQSSKSLPFIKIV